MDTIKINGTEYALKKIKFSGMLKLEQLGLSLSKLENINDCVFETLTSLAAFVMNCTPEKAAAEIDAHLENGGSFNDLTPLIEMLTKSPFFTEMSRTATETETAAQK